MPHGRQDLSSPTRDRTSTPCSGSAHFNHWNAREVPRKHLYLCTWENLTAWLRCKLCLLMTYGQTFLSVMAPVDIWAPIFPGQQEMLQRWTDQSWIIDKEGRGKSTESESHSLVSDSLRPHGLYSPRNSPGQNTGVGSLSLLQGIFPTQGSNPGLLHCRWILYQLSHKASLRILERVAYPFPSGSSWPRNRMGVCCIAGIFPTNWAIREAQKEEEDDSSFPVFTRPGNTSRRAAQVPREPGSGEAKPETASPGPSSDGVITLFRFFISNYSFWDKLSHECSGTDSLNFENCFSLLASVQSIIMKMTIIIIQEMTMGRTCSRWSLKKCINLFNAQKTPRGRYYYIIIFCLQMRKWGVEIKNYLKVCTSFIFPQAISPPPPYFLAALQGRQDHISLTSDWTCAPCSGSMVSQPLDHWGSPRSTLVERWHGIRRQASSSDHLIIARRYPGSP